MPEITEVEAARKAVEEHCLGKKIVRAVIADDPIVVNGGVSPSDFQASLLNKTVVAARRKGKNMWLQLDSPPFPSFQFGMAGAIYIKGVAVTKYKRSSVKDTEEWPSKYSKFFVELDDGLELSFTDKRRFARVRLLDDPTSVPPISELGPDALEEQMTLDDFQASLHTKKIGIKALLLDQSFISGIGNWIADEVLYQARIHPLQSASSLSKENCAMLLKCIREVIEKSVEVGADDSRFPSNWIYHSREKKPGKAFVDGKEISFIKAGGRTTAYVPELQKLSGTQATKAPARKKPTKQASKGKTPESDDNDGNDNSGEEDRNAVEPEDAKPIKGGVKKVATRKKSTKNDDYDEGDDEEGENGDKDSDIDDKKSMTRGTKAAGRAKRSRSKKMALAGDGDSNSEDDHNGTKKVSSKKQTNVTKKKDAINRNTRTVQKKAK